MRSRQVLSTGQLAKLCGVDHRTVLRWIQSGYIKAFKLPSARGDNRIPRAECLRFMRERGIPVPPELSAGEVTKNLALVVEDDRDMASLIQVYLKRLGFDSQRGRDGFEAGSLLHKLKPELLLLDLNIPLMDGFKVLEYVRETPELAGISVLVVSGMSEKDLNQALAAGADRVLAKPFDEEQFKNTVTELLNA